MDQDKVKPVAKAPQLSNQQLNETSSDSIVPDEPVGTFPIIRVFEREMQSTTMQELCQTAVDEETYQKKKESKGKKLKSRKRRRRRKRTSKKKQTQLQRKKQNVGSVPTTSSSGAEENKNRIENVEGELVDSSIVMGASSAMPNDSAVGTDSSSEQTLKTDTKFKNSRLPYTPISIAPMIPPQYSHGYSSQQDSRTQPTESPWDNNRDEGFLMYRRRVAYIPQPFLQNANPPVRPSHIYRQSSSHDNQTPRPHHYIVPGMNPRTVPTQSPRETEGHQDEGFLLFRRRVAYIPQPFLQNAHIQTPRPSRYNIPPQENADSFDWC